MKECPSCRRCYADAVDSCPADGRPTAQTLAGEPVVDRYRLERRLGKGGMGLVYEARHVNLLTRHALKIILPDPHGYEEKFERLARRFRQEARAVAAIDHPNVVRVTDSGVAPPATPFLVMEYVRGVSLETLLADGRPLTPARALELLRPVAAGVGAAHALGIVHRDLKPSNIMIAQGGPPEAAVKVLDFGLAKVWSPDVLGSLVPDQTSGVLGTPLYLSPEQCQEQEVDARADVYALGVIAYQMLTGRLPFEATTRYAVLKLHVEADPPPMNSPNVAVPPALEAAVRRALAKNRGDRQPSVQAFIHELADAASQHQTVQLADTLPLDDNPPAPPAPAKPAPPRAEVVTPPAPQKQQDAPAPTRAPARVRLPLEVRVGMWLTDRARPTTVVLLFILLSFVAALPQLLFEYFTKPTFNFNNAPAPTPAAAWRVKKTLEHGASVDGLAFAPDGKTLYTGGFDVKVNRWNAQTGLALTALDNVPDTQHLLALTVMRDGSRIVAATDNGVVVWDAPSGKFVERLLPFSERYFAVAASPGGKFLAGGRKDGMVMLWDTQLLLLAGLFKHDASVKAVAFSADSQVLASAGDDKVIVLWEVGAGKEYNKFYGHAAAVNALAFSPDRRTLASADATGKILLWDWRARRSLSVDFSHEKAVNSLAFSPDGKLLASGSDDNTVAVWNVETGKRAHTLEQHKGEVNAVAFSPDGRLLVSGSRDRTAVVWEFNPNASPQR